MEAASSNRKRSDVRRANVTGCQRCKSRKQRCDQNIPACSACVRAGTTCISVDIDGQSAPRSYIRNLEDRVAELELALRSQGVDTESVAGSRTSQDALAITPEAIRSNELNLLGLLVPKPNDIQDSGGSGYHALLDTTALQLAATYFEHSNFFSPVLDQESFNKVIATLHQHHLTPGEGSSIQKFQLCMVLAIAIRLLNRIDSAVPTTASESFFASAVGILTERPQATWQGDLQHLQNLLLIAQYTIFASNLSTAWHMVGLSTRLAIDLDLLNENAPSV
ncbi:uncharacterized protein FIESC28_05067 [Fusarium coffeatum]|uniref:Zn(2)-C6 fungal-type domain-containing protein n=1 Tax=Fusarium coffeatum TaxID=231269 RepID=A0A366RX37_9HYPO|nr:uncharacterized protein FIESC28_05067 [Fusarium coffeatum]RBR20915.1 hypothetical protein FIESC28_05067 [Fusarium coffeatum]